jgi:hypothetical protein
MKKIIKMEWSKSTKGTHVYANNESDTLVPTIYIKKNGLPTEAPGNITLTIEFDESSDSV